MRAANRPSHRIVEMQRSHEWNETLEDCVRNQHRGCHSNVMTRFFCGTHPFCRHGTTAALKLAKTNVKRYYASVGLQEHIALFVRVLKQRLPGFFDIGDEVEPFLKRAKRNRSGNYTTVPRYVRELIRERNRADVKLYAFVRARFWRQVKACK